PVAEFVSGDVCLFCHRQEIGTTWPSNRHNLTVRRVAPNAPELAKLTKSPGLKQFVSEVELLLGGKQSLRYLKRAAAYGQLQILVTADRPHWDAKKFGAGCAGCHCTAIDVSTRAFAAQSLDCYTCHG